MADRLLKAGYPVIAFDRSSEAIERMVAHGASAADSAAELAAGADLIITMLPRASDVSEAVLGSDGVTTGIRAGATVLDASTIDVDAVRSLAAPLAEKGADLLDAGVSGSPTMAREGTVTLIVGGEASVFDRHREALGAIGSRLIHAGPLGTAKTMKLANNMVAAITLAAHAEAYTLIVRSGADPQRALQAMQASWAASPLLGLRPPLPGMVDGSLADDGYPAEFSIDYMAKDLAAILESARQAGAVLPATAMAHHLYSAAGTRGDGALDVSALIRTIEGFSRPRSDDD
jgi:3-hydroxyisobutyrate dehydrogenase-like beta-hydroxyacid dehydrogenase